MPSTYSILPVMETRISVLLIPSLAIFRTKIRRCGHRNGVCNSLCGIPSELLSELFPGSETHLRGTRHWARTRIDIGSLSCFLLVRHTRQRSDDDVRLQCPACWDRSRSNLDSSPESFARCPIVALR